MAPPPTSLTRAGASEIVRLEPQPLDVAIVPVETGMGPSALGADTWMGMTNGGMNDLIAAMQPDTSFGVPGAFNGTFSTLATSVSFLPSTAPQSLEPLSTLGQGAMRLFDQQVCGEIRVDGVSRDVASQLSLYLEQNQWAPMPAMVDRLARFPDRDAVRILDLAVRHHTPPAILDRLLQGTADQAVTILNYALEQRAHPQAALTREPATGRFWRTEMTGDILGLGAGKTAFAGRVVEVTEDGRTVEGGETRNVAILMGTQARLKLDRELPAMKAFQELNIGDVRFYGMATVTGLFGSPVSVMVTNRAEGNLVTDFSRDVPASEQREVAAIVARDIARLTQQGWDMSGDIQFILGHGTDGRPSVQWIDFEGLSQHAPLSGDDWGNAYRLSMARFLVPMAENGFPSRNPAEVLP